MSHEAFDFSFSFFIFQLANFMNMKKNFFKCNFTTMSDEDKILNFRNLHFFEFISIYNFHILNISHPAIVSIIYV